jgi:hypothetical protein
MKTVDKNTALAGKVSAGGRINAFAALKESLPENRKALALKIEKQDEEVASAEKENPPSLNGLEKLVRKVAKE